MNPRPILLLLLLAACADGPGALVVHAPDRLEITVGDIAQVEATGAEQAALTYRWVLADKPQNSAPELVGVTASTLYLTPDRPGTYRVEITVSDGERTSTPAVTEVLVHPSLELAGTLSVRVLDASNGYSLPGAQVAVGELRATTDHEGLAVLSAPTLHGPVTVHVSSAVTRNYDHDLDPATPPVEMPWYRGATLVDVRTADLTIALHPSATARPVPVRGRIDESLFALIPEVAPAFSLGAGSASGQARLVMFAPLPQKPLEQLHPQDLFTFRLASSLPANVTTDDPTLQALAPMLGVDSDPDGAPLTRFETLVAPGRQTFFVLGGVVTLHLDGVTWRPQPDRDIRRLGRFETALSFAALVTLDVSAEGLDLSQPLRPEMLDELWRLDTRVEHVPEPGTDFLSGEALNLDRVRLAGAREVRATMPARVPDRRLEAWQYRHLTLSDGTEPERRLRVPTETGPSDTDLPFHLLMAAATTPAGVLPLGFALVRDMDRTVPETTFRWPQPTGTLAGARFEVVAAARRGLWAKETVLRLPSGDSRQIHEVVDERLPGFALPPLVHEPTNRWNGLESIQMGERADPTRLPYDRVRAVPLFIHRGLPGDPGRELLLETDGHDRLHTVLTRKYARRDADGLQTDDLGLWDIHQPAGATTSLPLPELAALPLLGEHVELRLDVTALSSDRRLSHDAFLIHLP